jgi:hypothetical protein
MPPEAINVRFPLIKNPLPSKFIADAAAGAGGKIPSLAFAGWAANNRKANPMGKRQVNRFKTCGTPFRAEMALVEWKKKQALCRLTVVRHQNIFILLGF